MNANARSEPGGIPGRSAKTLPAELTRFATRREACARKLVDQFHAELPPVAWSFFAAAKQGDWPAIERLGEELRNLTLPSGMPRPDPEVTSQVWSAIMEIFMAAAQFALGEPRYAFAFGRDIIQSIPPGSTYFGGTDPGRGLVTVLCRCQETGDPFFTLTQNALGDHSYLRYLREIYGGSIFVPSEDDLQHAWEEYFSDFQRRQKTNELLPGEMAEKVDGKVQSGSQISVMKVNGALSRLIFDRNPSRKFFVEESFPLDWMYPHLAPHGLILSICRQPLSTIAPEEVEQDLGFWGGRLGQMIGGWLRPETPVSAVCAFTEKVFLRGDLAGFTGDPKYVVSEPACSAFSKLRTSIAGVYAWHARNDSEQPDQRRMAEAADFAFRQSFALDPRSPEALFRFVNVLLAERRWADALLVGQTAFKLAPENTQIQWLVDQLARKVKKEQG
jgi:hypothetical protein